MSKRACRRRVCTRAIAAAIAVYLSDARIARADTLELTAAAGCPEREAFLTRVEARTPLAHFDGNAGRSFRVVLGSSPDRAAEPFRGSLILVDAEGTRTSREIDGADCEEVAEAIALVIALAIDPHAKLTPASPPAPLPIPVSPSVPASRATPVHTPPPAPATRSSFATRLALELGAGLGVAPNAALATGLDLGVERITTPRQPRHLGLSVAGHVRAAVENTVFTSAPPSADMIRALLVVTPCPLEARSALVRSELCAGLAAGAMRLEGEGALVTRATARFWSHVEAAWITTLSLGTSLFVGLRASMELPLTRQELVFVQPDDLIHRTAPITATFAVSWGMRL